MRYPGSDWRPIDCNFTRGENTPRLLIVHIMQGTLAGTDSWFRQDAASASSHFGVGPGGERYQWVDTDDKAWHAMAANSHAIGVECEGYSGHPLTVHQVKAVAKIYAWANSEYPAISMWLNKNPVTGSGLSWHGLGGDAWGGHTSCPGSPIVKQLPAILDMATDLRRAMR